MHKNQKTAYPFKQELSIAREYYTRKGITIRDAKHLPFLLDKPRCLTCECHRGDKFLFLVSNVHIERLHRFGFTPEPFPSEPQK